MRTVTLSVLALLLQHAASARPGEANGPDVAAGMSQGKMSSESALLQQNVRGVLEPSGVGTTAAGRH